MLNLLATIIAALLHLALAYGMTRLFGFDLYEGLAWYFFGATISEIYTRINYEQERRKEHANNEN